MIGRVNLEHQEAKSRAMIQYALYQGWLENCRAMTSNSTVDNIPLTIYYQDKTKKTIHWEEVKPHLHELEDEWAGL